LSNSLNQIQPPPAVLDKIIDLYHQGYLDQTVLLAEKLAHQYPKALILYEILGATYMGLSDIDKTIESYQKALQLNPSHIDAYNNIGIALYDQGKFSEAAESYQKALEIEPDFADAHFNLGNALKQAGKLKQAIESYKASLEINPNDADVLFNYGNALKSYGEFEQAIEVYAKVLKINPDFSDVQTNIDIAVTEKSELDQFIYRCARIAKLEIGSAEVVSMTGAYLKSRGYWRAAIDRFKKAIDINPDYVGAYSNMGIILKDTGRLSAAINYFNQAIKIEPDYAEAHSNQSLAFLSKGDFKKGWPQYEWRWRVASSHIPMVQSKRPRWDPLKAGRILLWSEQGIGDVIMFTSILNEIYQKSEQLIIQLDKRLIPLFSRSFPEDIIYYPDHVKVPETAYDFHIPFGSLPLHFRPSIKSFKKSSGTYLKADKDYSAVLREKLRADSGDYIVGITWRGGSKNNDVLAKKSVDLANVAGVLSKKGMKIVSLQYGDIRDECEKLKTDHGFTIHDVAEVDNFNDLDGLAALVEACDHIVSTDNLTVHIAGALGKKTTVLLPFSSDWRWGLKSEYSYWHSSISLLRQENISDWSIPLEKLKVEFERIGINPLLDEPDPTTESHNI
jgi:tetratricopeptide (TPR) repeat protein